MALPGHRRHRAPRSRGRTPLGRAGRATARGIHGETRPRGRGTDGPAYLRLLAETIRLVEREAVTDPGGAPGSAWESEVRFRALRGFHDNWLSDGEYPTPREAIRAAIDSEHPFCGEFLAPVAAQAQYALVHVLESHDAQSPMARTMPWATAETLTVLLDTVNGHLRHDHTAS